MIVMKKLFPIIVCILIVVVISIQFLTVAKDIDTSISTVDTTHIISHTIDDDDKVSVSVSYMVEEIGGGVYHVAVWVTKDNNTDSPDRKSLSKYRLENMSLAFDIKESEKVAFSAVSDDCTLTQNAQNICVLSETEYISLDLIIAGNTAEEHNLTVKYDIVGNGFNRLSRFENIEIPLTMAERNISAEDTVDVSDEAEYVDEYGYPLPGEENYEKWYNAKLEKVVAALDEADFICGKILSVEKTADGQTKVVIRASDESHINHHKNYSFTIRDNTYLRYGFSDFSADALLVGQRVLVSFASFFEDTLEYSGGERSVAVFSLFVLDDDAANPDPLTLEDYKYYDLEAEIEVEVEVDEATEEQPMPDDGILE